MNALHRFRFSKGFLALCLFDAAAVVLLVGMVWRIAHTRKAPLESNRHNSTRLAWMHRSGKLIDSLDLRGRYVSPKPWQSGRMVLLTRSQPGEEDVWGLVRPTHKLIRLASGQSRSAFAIGSLDGQIAFSYWGRTGPELFLIRAADKSAQSLFKEESSKAAEDWSSDGRWIAFTSTRPNRTEVFLLHWGDRRVSPLLSSSSISSEARFSPDGRWIAFTSDMSGRDEVYVAPVPSNLNVLPLHQNRAIRISQHGAYSPEWGRNSGELFYISAQREMMQAKWNGASASVDGSRILFPLSSVKAQNYEYSYGGYCADRKTGQLLLVLNRSSR